MYSGTTIDAEPTARPMMTRAATRTPKLGEKAASITPPANSAAVPSTVGRRPIRSAILPAARAPISPPISRMLVSSSLSKDVSPGKSLPMNSSAPEMTPVS